MFIKHKDRKLKVLLIDQDRGHAYILKEILERNKSYKITMEHCAGLREGIYKMKKCGFDAVFVNPEFSDTFGLRAVRQICQNANGTPILVITDIDDEKMALESVKEGAQDYLIIGKLSDDSMVRSVIYAMARQRHRMVKSSSIKILEDMLEDCDA